MSTAGKSKANKLQISLRELLAVVLIVALALSLYLENARRKRIELQFDSVIASPHLCIWVPQLRQKYYVASNISIGGTVYLPRTATIARPRVHIELIRTDSSEVIYAADVTQLNISDNGVHSFGHTINVAALPDSQLTPGSYLVTSAVFDGDTQVCEGISSLEAVNR